MSRETLQNHRFLQQLQRILVRKAIDLFSRIAHDEPETYKEVSKLYGNALRIGMLESQKDKIKLAKLLRFESTTSKYTSLEEVSQLSLLNHSEAALKDGTLTGVAVCRQPKRGPKAGVSDENQIEALQY